MKFLWAIALLECSNADPTACTLKMLSPVGAEADCRYLIENTDYDFRGRKPGTFVRPECRKYPATQRWGKQ